MASRAALSEVKPVVLPLVTTPVTVDPTKSVRSKSATDSVPLVLRVDPFSPRVSAALSPASINTLGESLVPVIVTVTVSVSRNGVPSSSVTLTI
ncbi:hypothetical protein Pla100_60420 [Neorhodopirellula pilleata]|uniref:Uncharacterized protein n=1 Tax=Neorhodopirellula pilleata TaxID=2714738 RepID=A0A5C5ZH81_9BACT|nr:hypothetical protein Pla100_60420 [Neorhodopirellula pilleata]